MTRAARDAVLQAQTLQIAAARNVRLAVVDLAKALGGGWQVFEPAGQPAAASAAAATSPATAPEIPSLFSPPVEGAFFLMS